MMKICWISLVTGACIGAEDPERVVTLLELPVPRIEYSVESATMMVWLGYLQDGTWCAVLEPDFEGHVNDTPMVVTHRGSGSNGIDGQVNCRVPSLVLENPPAANSASIKLSDRSRTLTCDLGDMLAPRSIELVPEMSWEFTPGQEVAVRWSPATDLAKELMIWVNDEYRRPMIKSGLVTFTMPEHPSTSGGKITFWANPGPVCPGGFRFSSPLSAVKPFTYRSEPSPPAMPPQ